MKIEEGAVPPAAALGNLEVQRPPPAISEPDRDEKEYLEWRQELL